MREPDVGGAEAEGTAARGTNTSVIAAGWHLSPLYGLSLEDDDGLDDPIFGDATLVSRDWLVEKCREAGTKGQALEMISQGAWTGFLERWTVPAPREHLVELPPHSLVAVRRSDVEQAERYAASIRAFLTAMVFLRGRSDKGFASAPFEVSWSIRPKSLRTLSSGAPESAFQVQSNNHVFMTPVSVNKSALRQSWRTGATMPLTADRTWDVDSDTPVARLLTGQGTAGRRGLMRGVGIHLADACCAHRPMEQIHAAISSMEMSLAASSFKELEEVAFAFLPRADNRSDFKSIVKARNAFIHEGRMPPNDDARRLARVALLLAYTFFDVSVGYLEAYGDREKFSRVLRALADSCRTAELVGELRGSAARMDFEAAVSSAFATSMSLTGRHG